MNDILASGAWSTMTTQQRRNKLVQIEDACKELETTHAANIVHVNHFCNGVYAREITILKGTTLVGKIHKYDQLNVLSKGTIVVATEEGSRVLTAPLTFISGAGTKRAGYAVTDVVWTVFHATSSTNESEIEEDVIAKDYAALDKHLENNNVLDRCSNNRDGHRLDSNKQRSKEESSGEG